MWASLNIFSAASGDFAKVTAIFFPLLPTKPQKAKMTEICGNFFLSPLYGIILTIFENAKNERKKTGNLFLISCLGVPFYAAAVIRFSVCYNSTNLKLYHFSIFNLNSNLPVIFINNGSHKICINHIIRFLMFI